MARRRSTILMSFGLGTLCTMNTLVWAQTPAAEVAVKEKALAIGAGDLNADGVSDVQDLDILIANLGLSADALANQGDLDLDQDVDSDDLAEMLSLLSSTIDINSRLIIDRLVEKGLIDFDDPYAQHPQHNAPFSGSGHHKYWSHSHPNHEVVFSTGWVPDYPDGHIASYSSTSPNYHNIAQSDLWPPNHNMGTSNTWPASHRLAVSGGWPPFHNLTYSTNWPLDHMHVTSRRWPPAHIQNNSISANPRDPTYHNTGFSDAWGPSHALATSNEQWPINHLLSISQGWNPRPASHSVAQSRLWPPNHFSAVSIGWPNADNPWPPNHFKTITEGPTTTPAGN